MADWIARLLNGLVSLATALVLLVAGTYAAYCLWDDEQIYAAAENVQAELLSLKPRVSDAVSPEETGPTLQSCWPSTRTCAPG